MVGQATSGEEDDTSFGSVGASEVAQQMRRVSSCKASLAYSTGAVELKYAFLSQRGYDPDGKLEPIQSMTVSRTTAALALTTFCLVDRTDIIDGRAK